MSVKRAHISLSDLKQEHNMPNDKTKPATTWIVQLSEEQALAVDKAYKAHAENFYTEVAERMKNLSVEDLANFLAQGTPKPPNKHDWASAIFMKGFQSTK